MTGTLDTLFDRWAIEAVLNAYARACDERDWRAFDDVFCADVAVNYGGEIALEGRDRVVGMIRGMLGGCGPTQHLLGNIDIGVEGDAARSRCYVRAAHAGLAAQAETYYEVWAEYRDSLVRTAQGWRISRRHMVVHKEIGSRAVLQPAGA